MLCEVLSTIEHQNLGGTPGVFLVGAVQPNLRIIAEKSDAFPLGVNFHRSPYGYMIFLLTTNFQPLNTCKHRALFQ
jgi:hypothetical protein